MIESIRIVRHTRNFDEMRSFYQDGLDMRPLAEWDRGPDERGAVLVFNGPTSATSVEVLTHPGLRPSEDSAAAESPAGTGLARVTIAIEVTNVGAHYETIQERGVEIVREIANMPWGHRSFSVRDPDGLGISFFQDMNRPVE